MVRSPRIPVSVPSGALILLALAFLAIPLNWILAWVFSVLVHELGHLVALWIFGIPVYSVKIGPMGARIECGVISPGLRLLAIAAGPAAGFALTFLGRLWPEVAVFALVQTLWNLLPVHPLDGGRFLRSLAECLDRSWAYNLCKVIEKVVLFLLILAGIGGTFALRLGWMPLILSIWALVSLWKEKYLANEGRSGYNIPNPNSEVCYDRVNSADPAHGAETCPIYRR